MLFILTGLQITSGKYKTGLQAKSLDLSFFFYCEKQNISTVKIIKDFLIPKKMELVKK